MKRVASLLILALLAACGGGGGGTPPVKSPAQGGGTGTMAIKLTVHKKTGVNRRGRHYVSYNTQGIGISVGAHGSFTAQTLTTGLRSPQFASEVYAGFVSQNVSCTGYDSNNAYSCVLSIAAPSGYDDFQLTTWDQRPSSDGYGGTFANTANDLSTNVLSNQLVLANQTNNFNFSLDGVVASVALSLSSSTMVAGAPSGTDPNTTPVTLSVFAEDADGNYIVGADPYVDGNGNPVTITLGTPTYSPSVQPSGGTEYIKTTYVNGIGETAASAEASASLTQGQVTVASPAASGNATGYNVYASDASGAEKLVNTSGPIAIGTQYQVTLQGSGAAAPATDTSGGLNPPVTPVLMPVEDGSVSFGVSSFTDPTTTSTTVTYDGGSLSQALISASVGSPTTPISVNTAALDFTQSNNGSVNVPGNPPFQEYTAPNPLTSPLYLGSAALGIDHATWFTMAAGSPSSNGTGSLLKVTPGATPTFSVYDVSGAPCNDSEGTSEIATGTDGAMWFTGTDAVFPAQDGILCEINTDGTNLRSLGNLGYPGVNFGGLALDRNGLMWVALANGHVLGLNAVGTVEHDVTTGGTPTDVAVGVTDGMVYVTDSSSDTVFQINPATAALTTITGPLTYPPNRIVATPDGNIWMTENSAGGAAYVAEISGGAFVGEVPLGFNGYGAQIAVGGDGNLYAAFDNGSQIAKINPLNQTLQIYPNIMSGVQPIAVAPGYDNSIWVGEWGTNLLDKITLP